MGMMENSLSESARQLRREYPSGVDGNWIMPNQILQWLRIDRTTEFYVMVE